MKQEPHNPTPEEIAAAPQADSVEIWPCRNCYAIHLRLYDKDEKLISQASIPPHVWEELVDGVYDQMEDQIGMAGPKH